MQVWTISRERYAKTAFTCEGLAYWRAMEMPISDRWDLNGSRPEDQPPGECLPVL